LNKKKLLNGKEFLFTNSFSEKDLKDAYNILIEAYSRTEVDIWGDNYTRLEFDEFQSLYLRNEIILVKHNSFVVGTIHHFKLDEYTHSFGLFAVDRGFKGHSIGKELIKLVESIAIEAKCNRISIEVLRPTNFEVPFKLVLKDWYKNLGYQYSHSSEFLEHKPDKTEKALLLKVPATFDCFIKQLA